MAATQQAASGSSASSASPSAQGAANSNPAPAAASSSRPGRKPRDPNAVRKVSPKVKALTEVRTYMIQHREQVLAGKTGVDRDIENERFERMLDSVEALFPPGHAFTIRRTQGAPANANPVGGSTPPLQAVQ